MIWPASSSAQFQGNHKVRGTENIGSPQRGRYGEMSKEGENIYSLERFVFKDGLFSPTRTSARAESWDEILSITLVKQELQS